MLYCICLPVTSRKPHLHRNEVSLLVNCARITERERPVERRVADGTPDIDNLEPATCKERLGLRWRKHDPYTGRSSPRGLVDVHLGDGLADFGPAAIVGAAADR